LPPKQQEVKEGQQIAASEGLPLKQREGKGGLSPKQREGKEGLAPKAAGGEGRGLPPKQREGKAGAKGCPPAHRCPAM
jgi:hypothetical protein